MMKRLCLGIMAAVVAMLSIASPTAAAQPDSEPGRVLIVTMPRLTWTELDGVKLKNLANLEKFFSNAAVAQMSVRTAGSNTRPGDAYLTIGAGNRMGTLTDVDGAIVDRAEPTVDGDPTAQFVRATGIFPTAEIIATGKPRIDRFNDDLHFGGSAGALGTVLHENDRSMAVLANADKQFSSPRFRQAALAAMDEDGQVWAGMVDDELLKVNDLAAYGLETDPEIAASVFASLWAENDVVLVEMSDLERAENARAVATEEQAERQYRRALTAADLLFGQLMEGVDLRVDTVIVLAPTAPLDRIQLTAFAMAGPGIDAGWATSSTTRRPGYVTLTDIAPTILSIYGLDAPSTMNDTRLSSEASDEPLDTRVETMIDRSDRSIARDTIFGPTSVAFIVIIMLDILLAMLCLARMPQLSGAVRSIALLVLAVPPVSFLLGLAPLTTATSLSVALIAGSVILAAIASLTLRFDPSLPPLALIGFLWLILAVDIATGGNLQINTIFGYSPVVAGRFAGFGNQAFSMIAISSLLLGSAYVDRKCRNGASLGLSATVGVVVWFAVTVLLDGLPSMGSDVGGVLAFVPAATVATLMFRGIRINGRLATAIAVGTVAILGGFAFLDVQRPPESRTHLGRFVGQIADGEAGEVLARKVAANLRVLTSVWSWVIPVALVYFVYLTWRPNHTLQRLNERYPYFHAFGVSALTLGVLAMALNDSGVSLPAIMLALVVAYVSYLVVDLERSEAS